MTDYIPQLPDVNLAGKKESDLYRSGCFYSHNAVSQKDSTPLLSAGNSRAFLVAP
jgi:hypothetical protein